MNKAGTYVSPFNTETAKYTGPLAIVTYEGPRNIENQMHGHGKILFANESTYEGELRNDMLNGYGTLTDTTTGNVYAGEFKDDMRHGDGVFTFAGGKYEGKFHPRPFITSSVKYTHAVRTPSFLYGRQVREQQETRRREGDRQRW